MNVSSDRQFPEVTLIFPSRPDRLLPLQRFRCTGNQEEGGGSVGRARGTEKIKEIDGAPKIFHHNH